MLIKRQRLLKATAFCAAAMFLACWGGDVLAQRFRSPRTAAIRPRGVRVAQSPVEGTLQNLLKIQQSINANQQAVNEAQGREPGPEPVEAEREQAPNSDDALQNAIRRAVIRRQDEEAQRPVAGPQRNGGVVRIPIRNPQINVTDQNGLVSIVVRNASLKDVVAMIGETLRLNIVCADDVQGALSISLDRVPLEQALSAITAATGSTWARHRGIIYVTTLAADGGLSPEVQGREFRVFELDFVDSADLAPIVAGLLSPVGQSFVVASAADDNRKAREAIVVEDVLSSVQRVAQRIAEIDVPPRQVQIEAHVLEVELSEDNRHGVNLQHAFDLSGNSIDLRTTGLASASAGQAFFAEVNGPDLTGLIEWLQTTADTKTLASPNLTVLNKQSASIQVGEQLGFRVTTTTDTATTESVETLNIGVLLEVTPQISKQNRILLKVRPEISSGQVNPNTGLPEEEITELQTDVMLEHGKGIVIGGLIQEKDEESQSKVPWFGDLHYIGKLFTRKEVGKKRTEIIIALIPRILPYGPDMAAHEEDLYHRATTRLLHGPLHRQDRPWEPRFHDAVDNPVHVRDLIRGRCGHFIQPGHDCPECAAADSHGYQFAPPQHPTPAKPMAQASLRRMPRCLPEPTNVVHHGAAIRPVSNQAVLQQPSTIRTPAASARAVRHKAIRPDSIRPRPLQTTSASAVQWLR